MDSQVFTMTVDEVASALKVSKQVIYRLICGKELHSGYRSVYGCF